MSTFFKPLHIYGAPLRPGGPDRFRFHCTEVTTDPATGKPRAYGWHGMLRTADGAWIWTPNPRTYDDWGLGGVWTDITDEPQTGMDIYVNADGDEFVDGGEYLDRQIGQYRPAARLREGWQLKHDGVWTEITSVVQVTAPLAFAMVTLADGFGVSVPHTHEVFTRTKSEIEKAAS